MRERAKEGVVCSKPCFLAAGGEAAGTTGVRAGAREKELLKESVVRPKESPPAAGPGPEEEKRLALNSSGCFFCSAIPVSSEQESSSMRNSYTHALGR